MLLAYLAYVTRSTRPIADEHPIEQELSPYEKERALREEEFDTRIAQIKEELALRHAQPSPGHIADELDPRVKNLPHNSINNTQRTPQMEYAD